MPDWSYHPIKKLLLDKLRPKTSREFIHRSMSTIASIPGGRNLIRFLGHMKPPQEFQKEVYHTTFPSPIGLSGHIDPNLSGINAFQELGFGFLEIGPIVLNEPKAQREPRRENSHILFSDHQEKVPLKLVIKKLTSLNIRIPIIAKIDTEVKRNEWDIIVQHLTPFVDAFIGTSEQINSYVDKSILALERPFYVSCSSDELNKNAIEIEKLIQHTGIGGIVVHAPCQAEDNYWQEAANANECLAKTLYFALTSIILPYDESFIGLTRADLLQVNPLILSFMSHDRMALAGTMISGGILYIQLARNGIKDGIHWTRIAFHSAAIVGFIGIFLSIGFGYFDWLHGLFWLILLPIYYFSFRERKKVTGTPYSSHGKDDRAWQYGLYGQLMFITLGFLIVVGGIVISTIGVSKVFVATDLSFLCMSPQMLESISNNLIPVIAHDRAGFGSALVSVGLLVLMISLWGFRKGERWIWNTLCLGALPAFIAGIGTHIYIGYTTFIHLLPVYFLVILYVLGLVLSYPCLRMK